MASISSDKRGNRTIQFVAGDRKRRSIRLGKVPLSSAKEVCRRVEALNACRITDTAPDADTARWVANVASASPELSAKLAAVGLIEYRSSATALGLFLTDYIASRTDVKPVTRVGLEQARKRLLAFFKASTPLRAVTPADADRWHIYLRGKYAEATAARTLKRARQFFTAAMRGRLITANPFEGIKPGSTQNPKKLFYITHDNAQKLIEACPDADWRAIVALARYGGLRCPSEVLALTWDDIDWDRGRFLARASKTERSPDGGMRWVPLFPELRPHLDALWAAAPEGQVHVINRYRSGEQNLRTTFLKIIHRAGLLKWPRLIQNLRATRETELAARFPLHVVTAWMGNTEAVAAKHYLSVRDDDFAAALLPTVQNPVQQPRQIGCNGMKSEGGKVAIAPHCIDPHPTASLTDGPGGARTPERNEHDGHELEISLPGGAAHSGAVPPSPDLATIAGALAGLSPSDRDKLAELLRAADARV